MVEHRVTPVGEGSNPFSQARSAPNLSNSAPGAGLGVGRSKLFDN